ncbi:MAG: TolC family protein, partial [Gemmatimonadota bacterium]
ATPIDVGQAEVQVGRARVAVLQAQNSLAAARMRLLQQMGVSLDQDVTLATEFQLDEPTWTLEQLLSRAEDGNPDLRALRRSKDAADVGVTSARSAYFPSLSLSTGWSGFTREASNVDFQIAQAKAQVAGQVAQCQATNDLYSRLADPLPPLDCTGYAFTDAMRKSIVSQNDQFPFNFEKSPLSLSLNVSVPIFQGFTRQRNLEAARIQRDDLTQQVRQQEIALTADLTIALNSVRAFYQSALLEEQNRDQAEQQLRLARERYRVGAITFVELMDAQTVFAQADRDRSAAMFAYHDAVTDLEALVGTSLR